MAVRNLHVRHLPGRVGDLIDSLASDADLLWPHHAWPAMRLDRPLAVGASGGHGPIRYDVVAYVPGQWIRFRFTGPRGFDGFHEFTVHDGLDGAELHHLLSMNTYGPARLTWPVVFRPLHNALVEDSLDRAERQLTGTVRTPARWSRYVRLLRAIAARF